MSTNLMTPTTLIIGSSRGIGYAITKSLLDSNHNVLGISRTKPKLINPKYKHINLDISHTNDLEKFLSQENLNLIDNFIICAGTNDIAFLNEISIERITKLYEINIWPSFVVLKHISKNNLSNKSIVLISSIWSTFGIPGRSIYGTSKAALVALAKHASAELSSKSIFINCISPGFTKTELSYKTADDPIIKRAMQRTSINAMQSVEAISNSLEMLLIPRNKGITGQEIFIDSGFSAHA